MKRLYAIVFFCTLFAGLSFAQSSKFYLERGVTLKAGQIPLSVEAGYVASQVLGVGYGVCLRRNIVDISDNMAIGLNVTPIASVEFGDSGQHTTFGGVYVPIQLSLNLGAGSTYDSDSNYGLSFAAGITPIYTGIWGEVVNDKFLISPNIQVGFRRYRSGGNALKSVSLRYDRFSQDQAFTDGEEHKTYMITLSWTKFAFY